MNNGQTSIRDALYEAPGPKTRRGIAVGTVVVLLLLAALIYGVIRQFAINGQLDARYWSFFTRYTTWRFIGNGLAGTLTAALTAGVITFFAGLLLMLGRISGVRPLEWLCTALIEFSRGVPTLLFIYFFFLVVPQLGIKLPPLWKIATPVAISAAGVVAEVLRSGVNAVPKGQTEAAVSSGYAEKQRLLQDCISPGPALCGSGPDFRGGHRAEGYHLRLCGKLRGPDAERKGADQQLRRVAFGLSGGCNYLHFDQLYIK